MNRASRAVSIVTVLVLLVSLSQAQTPAPVWTKVTLEDIHCMGCAKKIAKHVSAVPGVAEMRVDLKAKSIWAIHKQGMTPSPRAIWEAVELGDHKPIQMETPAGNHTSKPAS